MSVSPTCYLFTLEAGPDFPTPRPGQFVNVAVSNDLTLRRPFSVAGVVGPLGNEFTLPDPGCASLLVAGGIGAAGLRLLAQELRRGSHRIHAFVGARTSEGLLHHVLLPPTEDEGMSMGVATDDGSEGFHGTVTGLLERALGELNAPARIYCCGPPAMIAATADLAANAGIPCEALLEEMMACGVGACRGCVVATRSGYKAVCSDGPVFDTSELVLEELVRA